MVNIIKTAHGWATEESTMKISHSINTVVMGAVLALVSTAASATVVGSKHDLSASSGNNAFTASGNPAGSDQVCVFCHTPHAAATAANQIIPLWNRTTSASTFTLYADTGAGTLDGKTADDGAATGGIGGVSLACLSCHDGSIALASVLNAPGSGPAAETAWGAGAWINAGSTLSGTTAAATLGGVAGLGTDLSNDHPVAIQYAGGGYVITGAATMTGTSATANDTAFLPAVIGTGTQAWVDVDASGTKTADDLPLFTNHLTASPAVSEPFVECASCHNPHGTTNEMFLRASTDNSAICTSCHVK